MTQDEFVEMAREAGIISSVLNHWPLELKKFANLVAAKAVAKEREACAKLCQTEGIGTKYQGDVYAEAIRARGQA
jgi:hypothetical protein